MSIHILDIECPLFRPEETPQPDLCRELRGFVLLPEGTGAKRKTFSVQETGGNFRAPFSRVTCRMDKLHPVEWSKKNGGKPVQQTVFHKRDYTFTIETTDSDGALGKIAHYAIDGSLTRLQYFATQPRHRKQVAATLEPVAEGLRLQCSDFAEKAAAAGLTGEHLLVRYPDPTTLSPEQLPALRRGVSPLIFRAETVEGTEYFCRESDIEAIWNCLAALQRESADDLRLTFPEEILPPLEEPDLHLTDAEEGIPASGENLSLSETADFGEPSASGENLLLSETPGFGEPFASGENLLWSETLDFGEPSASGENLSLSETADFGEPSASGENLSLSEIADFGESSALHAAPAATAPYDFAEHSALNNIPGFDAASAFDPTPALQEAPVSALPEADRPESVSNAGLVPEEGAGGLPGENFAVAPESDVILRSEEGHFLFAGGVTDGRKSGAGILRLEESGYFFLGSWQGDSLNGIGSSFDAAGVLRYCGEWLDGLYHGTGTNYRADGSQIYTGGWRQGKFHGFGRYTTRTGVAFEGQFCDGLPTGTVTLRREGQPPLTGRFFDRPRPGGIVLTEPCLLCFLPDDLAEKTQAASDTTSAPKTQTVAGTVSAQKSQTASDATSVQKSQTAADTTSVQKSQPASDVTSAGKRNSVSGETRLYAQASPQVPPHPVASRHPAPNLFSVPSRPLSPVGRGGSTAASSKGEEASASAPGTSPSSASTGAFPESTRPSVPVPVLLRRGKKLLQRVKADSAKRR